MGYICIIYTYTRSLEHSATKIILLTLRLLYTKYVCVVIRTLKNTSEIWSILETQAIISHKKLNILLIETNLLVAMKYILHQLKVNSEA